MRALSAGTAAPSGTLRASGAPTRRQHSPRCARGPCGRQAGRPAGPPRSARAVGCSRAYLRAVRKALLRALLARSAEKRL